MPVLGVIDQPITKERWLGVQGRPTTLNGKRIATACRITLLRVGVPACLPAGSLCGNLSVSGV